MKLRLDWQAWDGYGEGDAYAQLPKSGAGFGKAAALCIGSRQCQKARGQAGDKGVMCPSFRITQDTRHSTQGRAATLRAALDGELGDTPFVGPELAAAMDLCVACKGCKRECPNGVDMAALRTEALAQRWQQQRPPWRTRAFAHLPQLLDWLAQRPLRRRLARAALGWRNRQPWLAQLLQRWTGLSAARTLPLPAARGFVAAPPPVSAASPASPTSTESPAQPHRAPAQGAAREVVLLVDCFAQHLQPELAHDALAVLRAAGLVVHPLASPPGQAACCGRPALSAGLVDEARSRALALLALLQPHLQAGRSVVGLEPSCLTMLRDDWSQLGLPAEPVQQLQKQALQLEELLARALDGRAQPLPWQALPAQVLVHGHCHQKAYGTLKAMRKLLGQVPRLQVDWVESSCCGGAGSFGYEAEHQQASRAMAELTLLPAVRAAAPDALLLASGISCRHQIEDGSGRRPLHLAQLLARALPAAGADRHVG